MRYLMAISILLLLTCKPPTLIQTQHKIDGFELFHLNSKVVALWPVQNPDGCLLASSLEGQSKKNYLYRFSDQWADGISSAFNKDTLRPMDIRFHLRGLPLFADTTAFQSQVDSASKDSVIQALENIRAFQGVHYLVVPQDLQISKNLTVSTPYPGDSRIAFLCKSSISLTIINFQTKQVVWRGVIQTEFKDNMPEEAFQDKLRQEMCRAFTSAINGRS